MDTLLHVGLSNAIAATVLALFAGTVGLVWRRRPALVHGMWLLVLLKLLTPPLVWIPLGLPAIAREQSQTSNISSPDDPLVTESQPPSETPLAANLLESSEADSEVAYEIVPTGVLEFDKVANPSRLSTNWPRLCLFAWAFGTAAWFALAIFRMLRFGRLVKHAAPAPRHLLAVANQLAEEMGLRRCPQVLTLPGHIAPMLWGGLGNSRLILPAELLERIDDRQLRTLLAHELAHYRRGDHWIRWIEFLALGLYWWNPVIWLARRGLREAEEQCCDAWVVSSYPESARAYATALVETIEFLAAGPAMPPLASGIERTADLKRRLTMIMTGMTPRALVWREGLALLGLSILLPLVPTLVRAEPEDATREQVIVSLLPNYDENADPASDEQAAENLQRAKAELERSVAQLRIAEMKLRQLAEKTQSQQAKIRIDSLDRATAVHGRAMVVLNGDATTARLQDTKGKIVLNGPIEITVSEDKKTITIVSKDEPATVYSLRLAAPATHADSLKRVRVIGTTTAAPAVDPLTVDVATTPASEARTLAIIAPDAAPQPTAAPTPVAIPPARLAPAPVTAVPRPPVAMIAPDAPPAGTGFVVRDERKRIEALERKLDKVLSELDNIRKEKKAEKGPSKP